MPAPDRLSWGDQTIAAGVSVAGPIAVARGNLDVFGTVNGDAYVLDGEIRVHRGAKITGDALALGGRVVIDGGHVDGERRSVTAPVTAPETGVAEPPMTTARMIRLVIGWFAVLTIIGIGVMIFAERNLDGVVVALERGFARAFWIGLIGQLLATPVLVVLVAALAITVIGILLIPFAIVSYFVAVAGLVTLGLLAVARLTGMALTSDAQAISRRGIHVRALLAGVLVFFALWMVAAAFTWNPIVGGALRGIAIVITWVAGTLGLGATIVSRGGTQRLGEPALAQRTSADELSWQTPTPVTGVKAARRPMRESAPR